MEEMTLCSPEHQEVFRRVWARVIGEREGCPAAAASPEHLEGDLSCRQLTELARAAQTDALGDSRPDTGSSQAKGANSCTAGLRRQILTALEGWQFYRYLARRARGGSSRILSALAADQHQQARRLAAAYFLLTGVRYWPTGTLAAPAIPSMWGALRRRYQAEEESGQAFLSAAGSSEDPALQELYRQLAQGCQEHCRRLRSLLEQSAP